MPLKRALETECNALSTKRELLTLNFSFLLSLGSSKYKSNWDFFCFGTTNTFIMFKFLITKRKLPWKIIPHNITIFIIKKKKIAQHIPNKMQFTYIIFLALWEIKKVWNVWKCEKKGKCARDKSRGIELRKLLGPLWFGLSRFEFHVCAMCLWFWTTASIEWDIYIYIYIFFFFNGCLDSLVLSLSYSLMSCM